MEKLQFTTTINAPREKVWQVLWDHDSYRKWTSVFSEGSQAITDWQEGSKVHFLDGKGSGMYSEVARRIDAEQMSFRHIGEVKDGVEQLLDERTRQWSGGLESYYLAEKNGATELRTELDMPEEFAGYFREAFPKALEQVKRLAEER